MWRDPLDELIEDLDAALPATKTPERYEFLPRLRDFQAVISPTLYDTPEQLARRRADPQFRQLEETVMRQLREALSGTRHRAATSAIQTDPKTELSRSEPMGVAACSVPELNLICTCGAEQDVPHTRGCPLFGESL